MTTIEDCRLLELPKIHRVEGNITPIEGGKDLPFEVRRVYYLYDVPGGAARGGHAHRQLQQMLVAVMGAFDVVLNDGHQQKTVRLDRAYQGLYMPELIWRRLENFSSGGICLVLASHPYDEADYLRTYDDFLESRQVSADIGVAR